ncbi:F-box/FBD/LRR-repeat protein At2g26030-like [Rosa rugosa]|uniref:F-box/FBD/LRR-repeat protein At2g26030-like n=1 Tax=Rosa rugosa TaxID=74645 RepID=UPI002B4086B4|nr:F-box/FBD/LRR-repeat protein At2g26030-like [Rosa rugosa]
MDSKSELVAGVEGRMSQLPDELICHILSFLPTVESVKTIVLSKRWNKLWNSVNTLDIDYIRDFGGTLYVDFVKFVDGALSVHDWSNIKKFRLSCPGVFYGDDDYDRIIYVLPTSGCFSSLKSLNLLLLYQYSPSIEKLITNCCPVVEDLEIRGDIMLPHDISIFNISAPNLKKLTVDFDLSIKGRSSNVLIKAPKLESLYFKRKHLPYSAYTLENPESLNSAVIDVSECLSWRANGVMTELLAGLSGVKDLCIRAAFFETCNFPAAFSILNKLELILYHNSYRKYVTRFLNKSPNLEYLVLELDNKYLQEEQSFTPPEFVPVCLSSHLKKIYMRGFSGRWGELEVLNYLLRYGEVLNDLAISSHPTLGHRKEESLYKEILQFPRASRTCEVKFLSSLLSS